MIGKTTNSKNIELYFDNNQVANIPINTLVENSPMYDRKWKKAKLPKKNKIKKEIFNKLKIKDVLSKILSNPNVCSKEWIWQQYDHTVMGDTIQKPGGDSGVVRVHGTEKAVAATVDLQLYIVGLIHSQVENKLFVKVGEILFLLVQIQLLLQIV